MHARTTREALAAALVDADYPATKDDLLATAERKGADEQTIRALRSIPPVEYRNFMEVLASVPLLDEDPHLTESLRALRRRLHTRPRLSERSKDIGGPTLP
jgi:hypothetical protein